MFGVNIENPIHKAVPDYWKQSITQPITHGAYAEVDGSGVDAIWFIQVETGPLSSLLDDTEYTLVNLQGFRGRRLNHLFELEDL